ncbi:hypothetical protein GMOD_00008763 [Pyrenophora seminiperda CCB06]|uniref:Uncharacterized protein n=1 Tax=Pyrenophora seminiperda CCB06 TaxID=1302712 RepID=A0A3M7M604_9PLEO|nr:hypothetical protein GMOD_00008763 [Pyrenophora seminiperda CCB06]
MMSSLYFTTNHELSTISLHLHHLHPPTKPLPNNNNLAPKMTKPCTLCSTQRSILIRCQIDSTQTWHFVCPGACWKSVSGGIEDARGMKDVYPHYRYGGMWKERGVDGPVSAKKPRKVKERQREEVGLRRERSVEGGEGRSDRACGEEGDKVEEG